MLRFPMELPPRRRRAINWTKWIAVTAYCVLAGWIGWTIMEAVN